MIIVVAILAGSSLYVQYRAGQGGPINITAQQFEQMVQTLPENRRQSLQTDQGKQVFVDEIKQTLALTREARRVGIASRPDMAFLDGLQRRILLSQVYRDRHRDVAVTEREAADFLAANPTDVDELMKYNPQVGPRGSPLDDRIRKPFAEIEILAARAHAEKIDREPGVALQLEVLDTTLRDAMLRDLQSSIKVTEDDTQRYYEEHKSQYEQIRARHILFSTHPANPATPASETSGKENTAFDKEVVRKLAEDVLKRIRAGEDFATLARQYSDDPTTKDRGGDLQFFGRGQMVSEFERAAFPMQAGQVSDLVESTYGFHIIKVEDRRVQPLDSALRANVANVVKQQLVAARTKEIEKRYPVTVDLPSGKQPGS